jgi:hypothetical protein
VHALPFINIFDPLNGPVLLCNTGPYGLEPITHVGVITGTGSVLTLDFP